MLKKYVSDLKAEFSGYNAASFSKDLMAGITVAAVALPLALAFGVSCGADAAAGLITAIIAGILISALSGASFQISGPTGAMTAILISVVAKYQLRGVFIASVMAGIILLICGILKIGKIVSLIPMPVVTGFTSGIAIIIALGQIDNLFGTVSEGESAIAKLMSYGELGFTPNFASLALGVGVILIMAVYPKKWNAKVPSSLVAIIIAGIVSSALRLDVAVVGEIPRTLMPENRFSFAGIDLIMIKSLVSPAISIAALGMIESLLCGAAASRMKNESFDADRELVAQGIGNILIPFFGGVPATAAIARTSVAIKSGCQTRLTGIFHAVGLLLSMFLLGPVMAALPLSALAGVLIVTAWRMNEWHTIKNFAKNRLRSALAEFTVTMVATVVFDLTIAIIIGVVFSVLIFIKKAVNLDIHISDVDFSRLNCADECAMSKLSDTCVVYITGQLFFANAPRIERAYGDIIKQSFNGGQGCRRVIFSLRGVNAMDTTGAIAMRELCGKLTGDGYEVLLCGVHESVSDIMNRSGIKKHIGEENFYGSVDRALLSIA